MNDRHHTTRFETDTDGWWSVTCVCGWANTPVSDPDIAADEYGDHCRDMGRREGQADVEQVTREHGVP